MKSYAVAAALALLPVSPALADYEPVVPTAVLPSAASRASAADSAGKSKLLNDIEAWRATKLPHVTPPAPITARFEPTLDLIKQRVQDAADDAGLVEPRKDFEAWQQEVLHRKYDDAKAMGLTRETYAKYSGEEALQAQFSAALKAEITQFDVKRASTEGLRRSLGALAGSPSRFDGGYGRYGNDPSVVTAPEAAGPGDPARYAKVRQILISQGASPRVIDLAINEAIRQNADPLLVLAVIKQESGFNTHATSGVGALGLMQIMPDTGRGLGVRNSSMLYDAQTNLRAGISFLKSLWGEFVGGNMSGIESVNPWASHNVKAAVAAYNAGPGAVQKYNGVPPYRETQGYVRCVLAYYEQLKRSLSA
jgi:soluble lytic murein transglycosylase-like protein